MQQRVLGTAAEKRKMFTLCVARERGGNPTLNLPLRVNISTPLKTVSKRRWIRAPNEAIVLGGEEGLATHHHVSPLPPQPSPPAAAAVPYADDVTN